MPRRRRVCPAGIPAHIIQRGNNRQVVFTSDKDIAATGTLFEGRFRSSLVQEYEYLLACLRYIELNPVRAGMVGDPGDYLWSSYRTHGLGIQA